MTTEFTPIGGNGTLDLEHLGPIRRRTLREPVGHQQGSHTTIEHLGPIRRRILFAPVVHGFPVPGPAPTPSTYYRMRAWHSVLLDYVYWEHEGAPDYTGTYSGHTISDLSRIRLVGER